MQDMMLQHEVGISRMSVTVHRSDVCKSPVVIEVNPISRYITRYIHIHIRNMTIISIQTIHIIFGILSI